MGFTLKRQMWDAKFLGSTFEHSKGLKHKKKKLGIIRSTLISLLKTEIFWIRFLKKFDHANL